ncbi:hypothetical protein [uncultured Photobacterium sp.]|uniref:hypothetical protein n=1 Tax=uncultured Photobacterium sp. TaxID=173973 RepID=UPI002627B879|nr:hypothetical protein [uncultured Photobacterium sp.]
MAEIEIKRRALERYIDCKSETVHLFLSERGGAFFGAIQRVATLLQYTDDDESHRQAVTANFDPLFDELNDGIEEFRREARAIKRAHRKATVPAIVTPDYFNHLVPVTHWIFNDVIKKLEIIDGLVSRIEGYWLLGLVTDSQMRNVRLRAIRPFGTLNNDIYRITNQLKAISSGGRIRNQVRTQVSSFLDDIEMTGESPAETATNDADIAKPETDAGPEAVAVEKAPEAPANGVDTAKQIDIDEHLSAQAG